ncbi:hypothetical protein LPTSP4_02590 [Leptospira ryugenii]|uniref:Lipoprotein n=1 Tax=Leptospira ryugenii TaxID=1917863 RepID=A0A2P2DVU0_9LEPT|nr:hypothetical protein [Leptospira ryugenii]GBF48759.1 hypothetical protein LPTSP4_02590 [Leptospira ryugenii]
MKGILLIILVLLSCRPSSQADLSAYLRLAEFPQDPKFQFEYGNISEPNERKGRIQRISNQQTCLYSMPSPFFESELGGKFSICFVTTEEEFNSLVSAFQKLDGLATESSIISIQNAKWSLSEIKQSQWKKEMADRELFLSWQARESSHGLVSYERYTIPKAEFYQWQDKRCDLLFPSYVLNRSQSTNRFLRFQFSCAESFPIEERILEMNLKWLQICKPGNLDITESFRSSESVFSRFLEFTNSTDEFLCPGWEEFAFQKDPTNTSSLSPLEQNLLQKYYGLVLPKASLLVSDQENLPGLVFSFTFLEQIGKGGAWKWGDSLLPNATFHFKQGNEFFSFQSQSPGCQTPIHLFQNENHCLSPGLFQTNPPKFIDTKTPALCEVGQIELTEYFPGSESPVIWPKFIEFQNLGPDCNLSSLYLQYQGDLFPLSSRQRELKRGGFFLVSQEAWLGWNLFVIEKPLSRKRSVDQVPEISILDAKEKKIWKTEIDQYVLLRYNLAQRRSAAYDGSFGFFPHPPEVTYPYHFSPGYLAPMPSLLKDLELSELLFAGTMANGVSQPERFLEWKSNPNAEGIFTFSLQDSKEKTFTFYKAKSERFTVLRTETGQCVLSDFIPVPESSFTNQNTLISAYSHPKKLNKREIFRYDTNLYLEGGYSLSSRISLHPEPSPFGYSFSAPGSFPNVCSPGSEGTPGRENQKLPQLVVTERDSGRGQIALEYLLSNPTSTGSFQFTDQSIYAVAHPTQQILGEHLSLRFDPNQLPTNFDERGLLFLQWEETPYTQKSLVHKLGSLQIRAVAPQPKNAQNEWIYFCNTGVSPISILDLVVKDESAEDKIVPYHVRFPQSQAPFTNGQSFHTNLSDLQAGQCAFLVDPDGSYWNLPDFASPNDAFLTVETSQTIGNGISLSETVRLFLRESAQDILVSSYGLYGTFSEFHITLSTSEYAVLKPNRIGGHMFDYEIRKIAE